MKKIFLPLILTLFLLSGCKTLLLNEPVQTGTEPVSSQGIGVPGLVNVRDVDGDPSAWVKEIRFTNSTVAVDGTTATVTIAGVSPGSGSMTTVEEEDSGVGDADIVTLDFQTGFSLVESPDTEVNVSLDITPSSGNATLILEEDALQVKYDSTDLGESTSGLTLGASPTIATSLAIGSDPADTGALRLDNAAGIYWEDATEGYLLHVDNTSLRTNLAFDITGSGGLILSSDGTLTQSADNYFTFTENSDTLQAYFGGTDVDLIWSDGVLNLRNAEDSVNAIVEIEGKDAGERGELRVLSDDDDKYIQLYHDDTDATIAASAGGVNINPASGSDILLDGTISIDAGVVTGATSITSTGFTGALTGNASTATTATNVVITDNENTAENNVVAFVADADADGSTSIGLESDGNFYYNPSTGTVTATGFAGALTGNATTATTATNVVITDNESTSETNAVAFVADGDVDGNTSIGLESDGNFTYNPSTGTVAATIVSAGSVTTTGNITSGDSFIIGDADVEEAELEILDGATATTTELNYLDIETLGTGVASKAVVLDGSGNYTAPAGTWNLGGATGLEIPNGTANPPSTTGSIALDTDGDGGDYDGPTLTVSTNGATMGFALLLSALPSNDNYILKYDAETDTVGWEADVSAGTTAWDDIANPDNNGTTTIEFDNAGENTVLSTAYDAAGSFFNIDNTDADIANQVYLLDLEYSVDDDQALADYIIARDAGGTVFTLEQSGDITTTGGIDITGATELTLQNDETIDNATDGFVSVGGFLEVDLANATIRLSDDNDSWEIRADDTGNSLEIGSSTGGIGDNVELEIDNDGDIHVTGDVYSGGSIMLADEDAAPSVAGELKYDNAITGLDDGGLTWYDDDEVQVIVSLDGSETLAEGDDGYAVVFNWNAGSGYFNLANVAGDITAVGPGYAAGAAFTDGVVSTGTSAFVWEGTSDDAVEFIIAVPEDPTTSDTTVTFAEETGTVVIGPAGFGTDNLLIKTDGTGNLTQATGISVDDSNNVGSMGTLGVGAITTSGDMTMASASPDILLNDSDDSAGTASINANSSGGSNDIILSIGVEDSTGESTNYIEVDGVSETIDLKKQAVLSENPKIYDGDSHHLTLDVADLAADATIVLGSDTNHLTMTNGTATVDLAAGVDLNLDVDLTVDGQKTTITGAGQANTLTLNESLTLGDGNSGTLTYSAASKTLTVADNTSVNQDLLTTSAVTFGTVDTGQGANELYDMNQNVLTTSSPTFVGLTLGDGATVTQSANNYVTLTENSDTLQAYFGGTDVDIVWSDGVLNLRNAEDSVNAIVEIEGKDAGERGELRVLSDGDGKYIAAYHDDADGWVASSSGDIILAPDGDTDDYATLSTDTNVTSFSVTGGTGTLGTTDNEWNKAYFGDSAVIYGQADQSNTLTSAATGWNFGLHAGIADDKALTFGGSTASYDWSVIYDETSSDRLEFTHTAGAGADVYFDLNDDAADSTFSIANSDGTYEANLSVDGDATIGNITVADAAITSDTGAISFNDENLTTTGNATVANVILTASDGNATTTAGALKYDNTITGMTEGGIRFYSGATQGQQLIVALDADPSGSGQDDYVVSYDYTNGEFYLKQDADSGGSPAFNAIGGATDNGSITLGAYLIELVTTNLAIGDGTDSKVNAVVFTGASGGSFQLGSSGVLFQGDTDGAFTMTGLGDGSDEDLKINLDDTANTVNLTSSTAVTTLELQLATPTIALTDATSSQTAAAIIKNDAIDNDDAVLSFGVDDSGGDDQIYIELDGENERIEMKENVYLEADSDFGDIDITSVDKLEGVDNAVFIDMGADGIVEIQADGSIQLDTPSIVLTTQATDLDLITDNAAALTIDDNGTPMVTFDTSGSGQVDFDVVVTAPSFTADASATPQIVGQDSDTSAVGTLDIKADAATATYDSLMRFYVDDSTGEDTLYMTVHGTNEEILFAKKIDLTSAGIENVGNIGDDAGFTVVSSSGTVTVESVVFTGGALSSVTSITDGTASWSSSALTGLAGVTISTGNHLTVGSTQWDNGSDAIDGEQIAADTIDNDSIDWGDMTDLATDGAVVWGNITAGELANDTVLMEDLDDDGNYTDWTGNWTFDTGTFTLKNGAVFGADDDVADTSFHSGTTITMYDDSDDTSVTFQVTDGSSGVAISGVQSKTPVSGATGDFASSFTGANLYGGTYVATSDSGDITLPLMAVGMNFCIITKGDIQVVAATNANDGYLLDGVDTAEDNSVVNTSSSGDIACFQYYTADDWLITTNGWSTE